MDPFKESAMKCPPHYGAQNHNYQYIINKYYKLLPNWCSKHGKDTCNDLLKLDENN